MNQARFASTDVGRKIHPLLGMLLPLDRQSNMTALGSKRTDALQHGRPISWRSECPLPEQALSKLATAANVGIPPFLSISALGLKVVEGLESVIRVFHPVYGP